MLAQLAKAQYTAKAVSLPPSWDSGLEDQVNAKTPEFGPGVPKPTNIFVPPSPKKIAVDAANAISDGFNGFIDDVAAAVCGAWANWQSAVKFVGVMINGPIGILPPAGMVGGGMMATPMIMAQFNRKSANYTLYGSAVAFAVGQAWTAWELGYTNPAIPFPGGAAASTTMPPSPNTPVPLASGVSPGDAMMQASSLKALMASQVAPPGAARRRALRLDRPGLRPGIHDLEGHLDDQQHNGGGGRGPAPAGPSWACRRGGRERRSGPVTARTGRGRRGRGSAGWAGQPRSWGNRSRSRISSPCSSRSPLCPSR